MNIRCLQGFALAGLVLLFGCASPKSAAPDPDGLAYRKVPHIQQAWLAEGFDFKGYDTLIITPTQIGVAEPKNEKEAELLKWASGYLRYQLVDAIKLNGVFATVVTEEAAIKPEAKVLRMECSIVEFAKGSGGARFLAGEFGAGQPHLRVRGKMSTGDQLKFGFDSVRHGDSFSARLDPGWTPEKQLQGADIDDLAKDLANFISNTANPQQATSAKK